MPRTKYMLIERPDFRPTAFPTHLMQDLRDSGETITAARPITLTEIRNQGVLVLTEESWKVEMQRRARAEAFEAYRAKYHDVITDALVLSWDHLRGEGRVRLADGSAMDIYACNIPGRKTWYPETACVFYMPGETVQVKLDVQLTETFVIGVTRGYLDNEKWESLDQDKLALRCDDDGKLVNGLFG